MTKEVEVMMTARMRETIDDLRVGCREPRKILLCEEEFRQVFFVDLAHRVSGHYVQHH